MRKGIAKSSLPRLTYGEILEILKTRELEDLDLILKVEAFLKEKRDYVFRMPKPGSPVVFLFSGGLDTTIIGAMLMEEFGLKLYPVFTRRGHPYEKAEEKAADFFTKYFQERYPGQFHEPIKIGAYFPPMEIRWAYEKVENTPVKPGSKQIWGDFFYSDLLSTYAAQCAYFLQLTEGLSTRTIITGYMRSDGEGKIDMTLTTLRGIMLGICLITHDFTWQITSLPLEKEIGFFYDKDYFIRWAARHKIPLEKTRSSCRSRSDIHCGECLLCYIRKEAFKKAGIVDKTIYANQTKKAIFIRNMNSAARLVGKKFLPKKARTLLKQALKIS